MSDTCEKWSWKGIFLTIRGPRKKDQVINTHAWALYRRKALQNVARGSYLCKWNTSEILLWSMTSLTVKSPAQSGATKLIKPCWGMTVWPHVDRGWCFPFFWVQRERESLTTNDSSVTQMSFIHNHTDWNPACNRPISQNSISYELFRLSIWWDWYFHPFSSQTLPNAT